MRARVTRSLLLPGCDWIQRRTIITPANGLRAGKPFVGRPRGFDARHPIGLWWRQ